MIMKFIKIRTLFFLAIIFFTSSCEEYLGGDVNVDPNKPTTVPVGAILPQIQISIADSYGGSFSRWNAMFVQQVSGVARQWSSFNQYAITPNRFDDVWDDLYENILVELKTVTAVATETESNHYLGIAKVLEAFVIMAASDVWGDIPYTEVGLGKENFNPKFDDQMTVIYPAVKALLDEAKALFGQDVGTFVPGSNDLYYGGDKDKWTKVINAILARYHLHLKQYDMALAMAKTSLSSSKDNMAYTYGANPEGAPWYRFNDGRTGDIEFHPTMKGIMEGLKDKDRLGKFGAKFKTNHPYLVDKFEQDLISYREVQFIIAESAFRVNASGNAKKVRDAYLAGIKASFAAVGLSTAQYKSYVAQSQVDPGEGSITMEQIMTQKYIGLFVQPEVFSDWRRTGIPSLTATSGASIPRRWFYSEDEYLFNSNAPKRDPGLLFERVGWDAN